MVQDGLPARMRLAWHARRRPSDRGRARWNPPVRRPKHRANKYPPSKQAAAHLRSALERFGVTPGVTAVDEAVRRVTEAAIRNRLIVTLHVAMAPANVALRTLPPADVELGA